MRPRALLSSTSTGSMPSRAGKLPCWNAVIPSTVICSFTAPGSALEDALVVELLDPHGALRRRVQAQLAEHALVEVLLDDLHVAAGVFEDVHRAGVLELLGDVCLVADLRIHLHVDEE